MKNQETKMTEQEKQEIMDLMSKTMEEDSKAFDKMHTEFLDQHDFLEQPSRHTKAVCAWSRENILLQQWNMFINLECKMAEFAGWEKEGKGYKTFYDRTRFEIVEQFSYHLSGYVEAERKYLNKEKDAEKELESL